MIAHRGIRRVLAGLAVGVLSVGVLASCGGGGGGDGDGVPANGLPPERYVDAACGTIAAWFAGLVAANGALQEELPAAPTPEEAKTVAVEYFEETVQISRAMLAELEGLDPPAVDGGAAMHRSLVDRMGEALPPFEQAVEDARNLPTGDFDQLNTALQAISAEILGARTTPQDDFAALRENDELAEAIAANPDCSAASSSVSG